MPLDFNTVSNIVCVCVCASVSVGFEGEMWDLILLVLDHRLSLYIHNEYILQI